MAYEGNTKRAEAERQGRGEERRERRPESRFELLRAVYPLNPGIPHFFDFPEDR